MLNTLLNNFIYIKLIYCCTIYYFYLNFIIVIIKKNCIYLFNT